MNVTKADDENRTRSPRSSVRTCAGCGKQAAPKELVRVVAGLPEPAGAEPQGTGAAGARPLAVDLSGSAGSRGAHVHPSRDCLARACRGGFARAFRGRIAATPDDLAAQMDAAATRRVEGLLVGARRARRLAIGADATKEAIAAGAPLVVIAGDAGTIASQREISAVAAQGKAAVFAHKRFLGSLLGRDEVAIVAVLDRGIASEIRRVLFMADAVRGRNPDGGSTGRLEV